MNNYIFTNLAIYKAIANESYDDMVRTVEAGRRPKPDGSEGAILSYDPNHTSFKKAMIVIAFTGMWLEALLHIRIVKKFGEGKFKEYDFKSYKEKLKLLGLTEEKLLKQVEMFQKARKALVHEKAYKDKGDVKIAQEEASNAHEILKIIDAQFSNKQS